MTYRLLRENEFELLGPAYANYGLPLPNPETALVAGAFDDSGKLVGFWVAQMQIHMEPLWLDNPHVNFVRLAETLDSGLRNVITDDESSLSVFTFAPSEKHLAMGEHAGFTNTGWAVMQKTLTKGVPV